MKYFYFLASVLLFVSCQKETESFIEVSIGNYKGDTIFIKGVDYEKSIVKNESGIFRDTLSIPYKGVFEIDFNDDEIITQNIYLEPQKALSVQIKNVDSLEQATFDESLKLENEFLNKKKKFIIDNYGDVTNMEGLMKIFEADEVAFIQKNQIFSAKIKEMIEQSNLKNAFFKEMQLKDVDYFVHQKNMMYQSYHAYAIKNDAYKTSENFPKLPENFNSDDETAFFTSYSYRNLITSVFQNKLYENEVYDQAYERGIAQLKTIKSQTIKNFLVENLIYELNPNAENLEERYTTLLEITTSKEFEETLKEKYQILQNMVTGKPSPVFEKYVNHDGTTSSLSDFKGKYVYIDVWATWCGPCVAEIPALQTVEKQFHDANIVFVSISIDEQKDFEKWKNFVTERNMGGVQLYADNAWNSDFIKKYNIDSIPRFILIGPDGNIVNADAPRPSDATLVTKFKELGL
ncbi:MAG: TlpA family protein disulfide reductase [Flavobacterium sp.]